MVEDGCDGASSESRAPCRHFTPANGTLRCDSGGKPMMTPTDENCRDAKGRRGLDGLLSQSSHVEDHEIISGGASDISSSLESWTRQGLLHHEQQLECSALDKFEAMALTRVGVAKFKPCKPLQLLHKQVNSVSVQNVYVLCDIVRQCEDGHKQVNAG